MSDIGGGTGGSGGGASGGGGGGVDAGTDAGECAACRYGEFCATDGGCFSDYDAVLRPYCDACLMASSCGPGSNFCLVSGTTSSCGVDCSQGQACPRGYTCQDVMAVLTGQTCSSTVACASNPSLPCTRASDCRAGSSCGNGFCAPPCAATGFCGCQVDADCAQESCAAGTCSLTGVNCITDTDCRSIRCVSAADAGGSCLIGANCAPGPGLTCADVK